MKRAVMLVLVIEVAILLLLPVVISRGIRKTPRGLETPREGLTSPVPVKVLLHKTGRVETMPLEKYVLGVVAAEMPASFALEALKAQAIAARTYAVKRMKTFGGSGCEGNPEADVCTNPDHCQAWISDQEMRSKWGGDYERNYAKIEEAVASTAGLVLSYQNRPVDPVYHSTCGGRTEDASEVWKDDVPYLKSVECGYCRHSPSYRTTVDISFDELGTRLGDRTVPVFFRQGRAGVEVTSVSPSGRVRALRVANTVIRGQDIRRLLGLPSTSFDVEKRGGSLRFTVRGKGHGVGMCQWGADGMARKGKTFEDILRYYYRGVQIRSMYDE